MPECAVCKKGPSAGDADQWFSVFQCGRDHTFHCCKLECFRLFEKRCEKASETLIKNCHRLNNDGHTSALRRLPPGEREKIKQHEESERLGLLVCPQDMKACDRGVPHCIYQLRRAGGFGSTKPEAIVVEQTTPKAARAPPPPPVHRPPTAGGEDGGEVPLILADDMLEAYRRDDQDEDLNLAPKQKKAPKARKEKQKLTLDLVYDDSILIDSAKVGLAKPLNGTLGTNGTRTANGTAWNTLAAARLEEDTSMRLSEQKQRVGTLKGTLGCSEEAAQRLLERHGWDLEAAADAYLPGPEEGGDAVPRWGPRIPTPRQPQPQLQHLQPQTQPQRQLQLEPEPQRARAAEQAPAQPPVPSQPPPPPLPKDWVATWDESEQRFYYWHQPTRHTQWEVPECKNIDATPPEDAAAVAAAAAAAAAAKAEEERAAAAATAQAAAARAAAAATARQAVVAAEAAAARQRECVSKLCDICDADEGAARELLARHKWDLAAAVQSYAEQKKLQEAAAKRQGPIGAPPPKAVQAQVPAREPPPAAAGRPPPTAAVGSGGEGGRGASGGGTCALGEYVCSRHWWPREGLECCMRLLQGERVRVTWTDGTADGWAFGKAIDDASKEGYFPQELMRGLRRPPRPCPLGERRRVEEVFIAPPGTGGYLTVAVGDVVEVLHPMEEPYVWAFASFSQESGWIPECVLSEHGVAQGGAPSPQAAEHRLS